MRIAQWSFGVRGAVRAVGILSLASLAAGQSGSNDMPVDSTGSVSVAQVPVVFTEGIGDFQPLALAVPASALGTELYIQSGAITGPGTYASTNVVTSRLGP